MYGQVPCPRRAHATVLYGKQLVVFGGGDGDRALNDLHALDVSNLNSLDWRRLDTAGKAPDARGYHTAQLCVDKLVVFGGVSGEHVFADLHVLDLSRSARTGKWPSLIGSGRVRYPRMVRNRLRDPGAEEGVQRDVGRLLPFHHRRQQRRGVLQRSPNTQSLSVNSLSRDGPGVVCSLPRALQPICNGNHGRSTGRPHHRSATTPPP